MKQKETAVILSQREIAAGIYDMWLETTFAGEVKAGQFLGVYPRDKSKLLPRPISVCEVGGDRRTLRIVYRVAGGGTAEFSGYGAGDKIQIMGPLGNGFPVGKAAGKRALLMGGGIGIPPILELAKQMDGESRIVLGYRDAQTFLREDFEKCGSVYVATEDGSVGSGGNVMNALEENGLEGDVIFACGPMPMLRAVKAYAAERGISAYISLEERMACGVGACLGCVVKTRETDRHSNVNNARICTEGPVFEAEEVDI